MYIAINQISTGMVTFQSSLVAFHMLTCMDINKVILLVRLHYHNLLVSLTVFLLTGQFEPLHFIINFSYCRYPPYLFDVHILQQYPKLASDVPVPRILSKYSINLSQFILGKIMTLHFIIIIIIVYYVGPSSSPHFHAQRHCKWFSVWDKALVLDLHSQLANQLYCTTRITSLMIRDQPIMLLFYPLYAMLQWS